MLETEAEQPTCFVRIGESLLKDMIAGGEPRLSALSSSSEFSVTMYCMRYGGHVGCEIAQLLTTAGDNPDRLRSEAALAHLCGAAPIPASSGRTRRHRLHRGGDRDANHALYTIALCRLRYDSRTRAYATRRTPEGLSSNDILRCLKRYIAREVDTAIRDDFTALPP